MRIVYTSNPILATVHPTGHSRGSSHRRPAAVECDLKASLVEGGRADTNSHKTMESAELGVLVQHVKTPERETTCSYVSQSLNRRNFHRIVLEIASDSIV